MKQKKEFLGFSRSMWLQCLILYIGIWGGLLLSNYLFIPVMAFTIMTAVLRSSESVFYQLFFLLPFNMIYKLSPGSTSLYTYMMLIVGVILLFKNKRIKENYIFFIGIFALYSLLGVGNNYTAFVKLIFGLVLLYVFISEIAPENFKNQIMSFALGMLGSSFIGTMKESWSRISNYYDDIDHIYVAGVRSMRFSGLNSDPNYYSIAAIIAIFLCLRLFFNKNGSPVLTGVTSAILIFFGLISYSKMFLLGIALLLLVFIIHRLKSVKQALITLLGLALVAGVFLIWAYDSGYIPTILNRLVTDDISTGRFDIWKDYLTYIIESPKTLLFGDGLGCDYYNSKGPHNAYIEIIFHLGIVGSILFLATVWKLMDSKKYIKRKPMDYMLLIIFLVIVCTLGILMINDLVFYFMLIWMSMNMKKEAVKR